jgi:HEAT repeats
MMQHSEIAQQLETAISAQFASAREFDADAVDSELRLETAADLFAAIESNDLLTRLSVLEAITIDPEAALALGSHGNRDLIAVLRSELEQVFSPEMRMYLLAALTAMPSDERLTTTLEQVWFLSDDTNERLCALRRLVQENNPAIREHLERSLLGSDSDRAQAVANAWQVSSQDSSAVNLRLSLAAEHFSGIIPNLEQHTDLWLTELRGAFADRAREWLEIQPEQSIEILSAAWDKLNRDTRAWLLELATKTESSRLSSLTDLAMRDEHLQLEAIQAASTPAITAQYSHQLEQLANHNPDPDVQAAAIRAGAAGNNRTRALQASARTVRIAAIQKLGINDQSTLLELLQDSDWRIRSAAAEQLSTFGEAGKRAVQTLLDHERLEVRMAVARVLQG